MVLSNIEFKLNKIAYYCFGTSFYSQQNASMLERNATIQNKSHDLLTPLLIGSSTAMQWLLSSD